LVQTIREGGDDGVPAMVGNDELTKEAFRQFTAQTVRNIAMRNANLPQTALIEVV
jgi:ATP-binding protein involved in chromosome partitioning